MSALAHASPNALYTSCFFRCSALRSRDDDGSRAYNEHQGMINVSDRTIESIQLRRVVNGITAELRSSQQPGTRPQCSLKLHELEHNGVLVSAWDRHAIHRVARFHGKLSRRGQRRPAEIRDGVLDAGPRVLEGAARHGNHLREFPATSGKPYPCAVASWTFDVTAASATSAALVTAVWRCLNSAGHAPDTAHQKQSGVQLLSSEVGQSLRPSCHAAAGRSPAAGR